MPHASDGGVVFTAGSTHAVVSASHSEDSGLAIPPDATPNSAHHEAGGDISPSKFREAYASPSTMHNSWLPTQQNSKASSYPTTPSQVIIDTGSAYCQKPHPSPHPHVTPTLASEQQRLRNSPINGICRVSHSAGTTPHRYSSSGMMGVALRRDGLVCLPPLFTDELLQRKEVIKSRLQFKSE